MSIRGPRIVVIGKLSLYLKSVIKLFSLKNCYFITQKKSNIFTSLLTFQNKIFNRSAIVKIFWQLSRVIQSSSVLHRHSFSHLSQSKPPDSITYSTTDAFWYTHFILPLHKHDRENQSIFEREIETYYEWFLFLFRYPNTESKRYNHNSLLLKL